MVEFPRSMKDGDVELIKLDPTFESATRLFELVDQNREFLSEWLGWVDYVKKPEDEYSKILKDSDLSVGEYAVFYKGSFVGYNGFVKLKEKHQGEIGYFLAKEAVGFGVISRTIKLLENFAFENLGLQRIEIRMDVENFKSEAIPKRLGYVFEGVLRKAFVLRGEHRDIKVYSKLKSEWEKENKNA